MDAYENKIAVLRDINNMAIEFIRNLELCFEEKYQAWSDAVDQEVRKFQETGVLSTNFGSLIEPAVLEEISDNNVINSVSNSSKENNSVSSKRSQPPVLQELSQQVNRQDDTSKDSNAQVIVKKERLSQNQLSKCNKNSDLQVKTEQLEMPPPSKPLRQPRQTRKLKDQESLKIKVELIETTALDRDSDVILEDTNISTIVIDNDEKELETSVRSTRARTKNPSKTVKEVTDVPVTRSSRTNTRAAAMNKIDDIELAASKQVKRARASSSENEALKDTDLTKTKAKIRKTRSGSDKNIITTEEIQTKVMFAINKVDGPNEAVNLNQTYVCDNNDKGGAPQIINDTVVLKKISKNLPKDVQYIVTGEDLSAPSLQNKQKLKSNLVFNPYINSPVQKKVEAFEKLGAASASHTPFRSKRQKGKINQSEQKASLNKFESPSLKSRGIHKAIPGSAEKQSSKALTPSMTYSSLKPRSALKSSQAAFRERELLRQQKENDARLKREALLQATADEKRRKLDEKQLKARQQRDAMLKQKVLGQSECAKQEKQKNFSKEEKLIKKKEQKAQKFDNVVRKAAEEKEKDKAFIPKYMKTKTPPLLIADCYDSDEVNFKPITTIPLWQTEECIRYTAILKKITKQQNEELFPSQSQTVDLQEIFPTIEPKKLIRTSSAIWNRSEMNRLTSMHEKEDSNSH